MSRIFEPTVFCRVPASKPHNQTAKYFVAIGLEDWERDGENTVIKLQMEYDGKRQGRKVPSYTVSEEDVSSEDWDNISKAVEKVRQAYKGGVRNREIPFE